MMLSDNRFFRPLLGATIATLIALSILIGLGVWQIERLHWKLNLIATISERMTAPAVPAPAESTWATLDLKALEYRHLKLTGHYLNDRELHYFAQDSQGTSGFDIITPFVIDDSESADAAIVLVDRGFVPKEMKDASTRLKGQIEGPTTVTGVARQPQARGIFSAPDDVAGNIWFTRDPATMGAALKLAHVAPFYVEADATPNLGGFPIGGRTQVTIRNEHLQYAITWFALALGLLVIYFSYHQTNGRIGRRPPERSDEIKTPDGVKRP